MPGSGLQLAALSLALLLTGAASRRIQDSGATDLAADGAASRTNFLAEHTSGAALEDAIRTLVHAPSRRRLMKTKPDCSNFSGYYGSQCTGSPGFWTNNNGWCLWPAQTITIGTLPYARDPDCWNILDQGTNYDITKLCFQLIPAILGRLNYARSGASVPSNINDCINLGNAMIGDRVINPVGDGLCACCATNSCNAPGSTSVCRDPPVGVARDITTQGCTPLDGSKSYTNINTVINCLGSWNVNGECPVTPAPPPPRPPPPPYPGCTFTQGYWKNHPEAWPVSSLKLGTVSYTKTQLLQILNTDVNGNGLISLAYQLIAAKLNNLQTGPNKPTVPQSITNAINAADALIGSKKIPPIGTDSVPTAQTSPLVDQLTNYNQGGVVGGPGHCNS
ncbi:hypothetical protein ABPG77_009497 [Micractinium sp. CCAP 211/92]